MADRKLINDYENAVMNLAVSDMLEQFGRELEEKYKDVEDIVPSPEAAEKFEKELNKAYRNGQLRSFRTRAVKFARYAVTVCAAFIVIFTMSVISVDALRFRFLEWLTNIHENYTTINLAKNKERTGNVILAEYMPEEYKLITYNNGDSIIELCYSNKATDVKIRIYLNACNFNTDNEDTSSEEVYINGNKGQYQKKELATTLLWYDNKNSYWISTNDTGISKDELVKIAQSVN
ncbi:MAG: DUF4367 domain-containing protein [Eubacterium sp.]|nr:DUF4367 domain-containing protein [Eubacterium sp.]